MSLRQVSKATGIKLFSRSFTCGKIRLQDPIIEDVRVDEAGRPLIPSSLKQRIQESRVRIDIKPTVTNEAINNYENERLRIVPGLKTFFGGNPIHEDNINQVNAIIRKYINLPTRIVDNEELRNSKFISIETYREMCQSGTRLKDIHYKELTSLLHRLRTIDLQLMPSEVKQVLQKFQSKSSILTKQAKVLKTLDEFGRAKAVGKRKCSVAEVFLTKGEGESLINGKSLVEYFPDLTHRKRIAYPLQVVSQEGGYNIFATVSGGGISGQAEAIMYGIAKALIIHNPLLKPRLYKAGLMTRDARIVERKKPGKVKARKSPTWVKR